MESGAHFGFHHTQKTCKKMQMLDSWLRAPPAGQAALLTRDSDNNRREGGESI